MNEIIEQLLDRVTGLELALCEMQMKEEKQRKNESSPCTPSKKEKREKEEKHDLSNAHAREKKCFVPPTVDEVQAYLNEIQENTFSALRFVNYYDSVGWMIGPKRAMKDWKAAVRCWQSYEQKRLLRMKDSKSSLHPVATPQFHETEAYLQNMERERKQAVSYEEYKRQLAEGRLR